MNDTHIDLLEIIAESNDLVLSDNLIQFASVVWELAYKQARKDALEYVMSDICQTNRGGNK
jgi:hypothetical protein